MTDEAPVDDGLADFRGIVKGIVKNVLACTQARDLDLTIGLFATEINKAGYGALYGAVQAMASRDMVLSMRKIFDDDKRWPQRTIPAALDWIETNKEEILGHDNIHERMGGCRGLREALAKILGSLPGKKDISHCDRCQCPSCSFDRVKTMADKEVAHNEEYDKEVYDKSKRPEYRDIDRVIDNIIKPFFREFADPILENTDLSVDQYLSIEGGIVSASNAFRRLMHEKFGLSFEEAPLNRSIA